MRFQQCPKTVLGGVLGSAMLFAGCATSPMPEARVASSQGAIRGAQEAGATDVPQASLHLKLAQEQRERALVLLKNGDNERATFVLMRAEADAELAVALSHEAQAHDAAEKMLENVQALKKKAAL
ncbi:MAG: DUF4398 domain-containing protein [Polyangiales bacterium]